MKYLSIMAGLMALSASPLLAKKTAEESPVPTTTPLLCGSTQACGNVDVPAPTAMTLKQAKPSPEFRSYVRLFALNILADTAMALREHKITSLREAAIKAHLDLFAGIVVAAFNATPRTALQGEEKAFVDEFSQLIPELYMIYKSSYKKDMEARKKMETIIDFRLKASLKKYPQIVDSWFNCDFFDVMAIAQFGENRIGEIYKLNAEERTQVYVEILTQIAEHIRKNEL